LTRRKGIQIYYTEDYLKIFVNYFLKRGYIKEEHNICLICNSTNNSLMEILDEEGCYEVSFAGKTLKFSKFKGSKCRIGGDSLWDDNQCRCCLLDITKTS
jgi:hypothetical protein